MKRKFKSRRENIRQDKLEFDHSYQRPYNKSWSSQIAANLDPDAFQPIHVSRRSDGGLFVVDGQHRVMAVRLMGEQWQDTALECAVYDGLTVQDEAALFTMLNETRPVRAIARFMAAMLAGINPEAEIGKMVTATGWRVGSDEGHVRCVVALLKAHKRGGARLIAQTLNVLHAAYGGESPEGPVFSGIAKVLHCHAATIDPQHLITSLAKRRGGQNRLIGDGRSLKDIEGSTLDAAIAELIIRTYNHRRQKNTLSSLRKG